ncbi:MAG: prephenate dehydrogenase/arogenate dehydrogenase family protein [gamma proteobacterium symbiont of Bathyaustriella thionipta]|nr:prephenate dehydrogenase/arogenate dehydrogenase family protein [gamma proteobacterium symbiont of Bathyaustriella thionipta]
MIKKLAIIGVGLIGGSFALALRSAGKVEQVVGCGRSEANLKLAQQRGIIDCYTHDLATAVRGADVVFLAVPLGAMRDVMLQMQAALEPHAIITDGGSVKGSVVQDARLALAEHLPNFVPSHPIAGTERSGAQAAFAELFENRRVIVTPIEETSAQALQQVSDLWLACGAELHQMPVEHHDEVLAATSHLPHMLAFTLVDTLAAMKENDEIFRYAAGGFRDFTRIASSNPAMWRDICMANQQHLGEMLEHFAAELTDLAETLRCGDGEHLLSIFARAKAARDRFIDCV